MPYLLKPLSLFYSERRNVAEYSQRLTFSALTLAPEVHTTKIALRHRIPLLHRLGVPQDDAKAVYWWAKAVVRDLWSMIDRPRHSMRGPLSYVACSRTTGRL